MDLQAEPQPSALMFPGNSVSWRTCWWCLQRAALCGKRYTHTPPRGDRDTEPCVAICPCSGFPEVPIKLAKCCPNHSASFEFTNPLAKKEKKKKSLRLNEEACSQYLVSHWGACSESGSLNSWGTSTPLQSNGHPLPPGFSAFTSKKVPTSLPP